MTLEELTEQAEENLDYDLVGSVAKAKLCIAALRKIKLRRPRTVTVSGNPVAFEDLMQMLERAEAWYAANAASDPSAASGSSQSMYYDLSNIRQ
jgi:hypothetical protein